MQHRADVRRSFRASRVPLAFALVLLAPGAVSADDAPGPFAAQAEGYLGGTVYDIDGANDQDGFNGGGTGSVVAMAGPLHVQLDTFGDYTDPGPEFWDAGFGGHLGFSDPELGAFEMTGGYDHLDLNSGHANLWRVGGEVETYLEGFTVGTQGGVVGEEDGNIDDFYYWRGFARIYPTPNFKLEGGVGYADAGPNGTTARILAEFRPEGAPVSAFVRWEALFSDNLDEHAAVVGVRLLLDQNLTLERSDRTYFRDRCVGILLLARIC